SRRGLDGRLCGWVRSVVVAVLGSLCRAVSRRGCARAGAGRRGVDKAGGQTKTPEPYRTARAERDRASRCPRQDSNLRHLLPEGSALSTELRGRVAVERVQHSARLAVRSRAGGASRPKRERLQICVSIYMFVGRREGSDSVGHDHSHAGPPSGSASGRYRRRLTAALLITAGFAVMQFVVAFTTDSLALLSDAAHMLTDVIGLLMALGAILLAQHSRPTHRRTFGMYRTEVLAALGNAVLLFGVAGYVTYEAFGRIGDPPEVPGLPVLVVAAIGLLANAVAFFLLRTGANESLNVRGAYLEVVADMIGSVGVLVSGAVTLTTGWRYMDPIVGVLIGVYVLPRTFLLAKRALRILLQHAPKETDVARI